MSTPCVWVYLRVNQSLKFTVHQGMREQQKLTNHSFSDVSDLTQLAFQLDVDFVVAGPEAPLCDGLADRLAKMDIPCFGPVAALARLEGSKLHAKQVMQANGVPTAAFHVLNSESDIEAALDDFSTNPWVVKRDVLAGGKGVVVTDDRDEAKQFILESIESDGQVLLEAFLPGEEASMLVVMDGSDFVCLPASQDHKREFEGDKGRNTGGMGAYAPAPVYTEEKSNQRPLKELSNQCTKHYQAAEFPTEVSFMLV